MSERKGTLHLPGASLKLKGQNIPLAAIVNSGCYEDFVAQAGRRIHVLSVELSDHGELYRIEGMLASEGNKKLKDLLRVRKL
jgi:hypothetical protein